MILLLIAAVAAIALLAALGLKMTRARARQRQEELASARRAAEASRVAAETAAKVADERRQTWADADALTSVIPAIKMPWPTQLPGAQSNGYPDLEGEYPGFSSVTPFGSAPYQPQGRPARQVPLPRAGEPSPFEPAHYEQDRYEHDGYEQDRYEQDRYEQDGHGRNGHEPPSFGPAPPGSRQARKTRERGPFEPALRDTAPDEPPYPAAPQRDPFETANGLPKRPRPAERPGPAERPRPAERGWPAERPRPADRGWPAEPGPQLSEPGWPGTRRAEPMDEQMMPAPRPEEFRLPRRAPGPRPVPPAAADQPLAPLPRADEPVTTAVPGEPGDRARKRPTHGSHRGGHAKRRRG